MLCLRRWMPTPFHTADSPRKLNRVQSPWNAHASHKPYRYIFCQFIRRWFSYCNATAGTWQSGHRHYFDTRAEQFLLLPELSGVDGYKVKLRVHWIDHGRKLNGVFKNPNSRFSVMGHDFAFKIPVFKPKPCHYFFMSWRSMISDRRCTCDYHAARPLKLILC
jgi:hypothetical protein